MKEIRRKHALLKRFVAFRLGRTELSFSPRSLTVAVLIWATRPDGRGYQISPLRGSQLCILLSFLLSVCLFFEGCRKQATATKLIDGLYSYQTMDQARSLTAPKVWQVRESSRSPDQTRSRYEVFTVAVENYVHLDVPGELILYFFNGRLTSTVFYASDFEKYKANLEKYENIKFEKLEIYRPPHTKIWTGRSAVGLDCVGWEDTVLAAEIENWIRK